MERDRAAVLTLRSAAKGVIDYTQFDQFNPMWWKRWRFLTQAMSKIERGEILRRAFEFQLALVSSSKISSEDFSAVQKEAKELFRDYEASIRPWLGITRKEREQQQGQTFEQQWQQFAGFNPKDPEAVYAWEREIKKHTQKTKSKRIAIEQEQIERQNSFYDKVDKVRQKRLRQQGR